MQFSRIPIVVALILVIACTSEKTEDTTTMEAGTDLWLASQEAHFTSSANNPEFNTSVLVLERLPGDSMVLHVLPDLKVPVYLVNQDNDHRLQVPEFNDSYQYDLLNADSLTLTSVHEADSTIVYLHPLPETMLNGIPELGGKMTRVNDLPYERVLFRNDQSCLLKILSDDFTSVVRGIWETIEIKGRNFLIIQYEYGNYHFEVHFIEKMEGNTLTTMYTAEPDSFNIPAENNRITWEISEGNDTPEYDLTGIWKSAEFPFIWMSDPILDGYDTIQNPSLELSFMEDGKFIAEKKGMGMNNGRGTNISESNQGTWKKLTDERMIEIIYANGQTDYFIIEELDDRNAVLSMNIFGPKTGSGRKRMQFQRE